MNFKWLKLELPSLELSNGVASFQGQIDQLQKAVRLVTSQYLEGEFSGNFQIDRGGFLLAAIL